MAQRAACPICRKPVPPRAENRSFPFCSDRCRLVDLAKWLGEEYRVPGGRPGDGGGGGSREPLGGAEEGEDET